MRRQLSDCMGGGPGDRHRAVVILALLALRWCGSAGSFLETGEFAGDSEVPCADWDDMESLARLDRVSDEDLISLAVGSACHEEQSSTAGSTSRQGVLTSYLLDGVRSS